MIRYGASAQKMKPIPARDIFTLRLKLLIIMIKASLKGNPLGTYRRQAIINTAQFVFSEARAQASQLEATANGDTPSEALQDKRVDADHFFLQETQLLAVMARAWASGKAPGRYRKRAMVKNIDQICAYLSKRQTSAETIILKVA